MKELKDYLHLYLGCRMNYATHHEPQDEIYVLTADRLEDAVKFGDPPILRPLSDMTEEEYREWMNLRGWVHENFKGKEGVENGIHCGFGDGFSAAYLLKQGFDLFGLIESGFAIDKSSIELQNDKRSVATDAQ